MPDITATMVKDLRVKTGAGMMDCKKALVESAGDIEGAVEFLRKAGIAKAAKKAGRETKEGKISSYVNKKSAAMAEVLCETDFVAKNDEFFTFCEQLCKRVANEFDDTGDLTSAANENETATITALIAKVGENIQLRRAVRWHSQNGQCASYIHMGGKIGVLIEVENESNLEYLNDLCMHIAAYNPLFLTPDDVPLEFIEKEKEIAAAQPELAGKPEEILEKILQGKIKKWYKENCLTNQIWIKDDKKTVQQFNPDAKILRFLRWQIGEEM